MMQYVLLAGVVENFSRWTMFFKECVYEDGEANVPMQTVKPGYKEGFAAHKKAGIYGVHMKCTFVMETGGESGDGDEKIHFMVDIPWDVSITKENRLALAVCNGTVDDACNSLTLSDMSTRSYSFMTGRMYKNSVKNIAQCNNHVCLMGTMGTSYTPIVRIKLYPKYAKDLSEAAAKKLKKIILDKEDSDARNRLQEEDYKRRLNNILKYADKSSSRMLTVCTGFTFVFVAIAVSIINIP